MLFFKAAKKHLTLGFWRGVQLDDPKGLLEGSGQQMRHLKIRELKDIPKTQVGKWIRQARRLNKELGNPTMKGK